MKTSIFRLGSVLLGIGLFLISLTSFSQEKLTKEEKKAARKDQQLYNYQVVDSMLKSKSFILEADFLSNEYGVRRPVNSNLNFIMIDSLRAVLQTGNNVRMGNNGVGGVTAEGNISGLKITKNPKSLSYFLRFTIVSQIGTYDVEMTVYSDKHANATISGLQPGKLNYNGKLRNLYESRAYKGMNSI